MKYTSLYEVAILMRRVVGDSLQKLCEQAAVEQDSNKLMQLRVWMQGAALLLFVVFMLLFHRH